MFSVTVRDHMMVAHSLRGEVFGPAQRMHGATYAVEATFRVPAAGRGPDRDRHRARGRVPALAGRRADQQQPGREPGFAGVNTTTEVLARYLADALADAARSGDSGLARGGWPASPWRCTSRRSPRRVTSARCERAGRLRPGTRTLYAVLPPGSTTRSTQRRQHLRPAGAGRLARHGWTVRELPVDGAWPRPMARSAAAFGRATGAVPDGASCCWTASSPRPQRTCCPASRTAAPGRACPPAARRDATPTLAVGRPANAPCCRRRTAVLATSEWTRRRLVTSDSAVRRSGYTSRSPASTRRRRPSGTDFGGALLCVAAVIPSQGSRRVGGALAALRDLSWQCRCVGSSES